MDLIRYMVFSPPPKKKPRQGRVSEFVQILECSRGEDANLNYKKSEEDQMRQLDTLAAYYLQEANK